MLESVNNSFYIFRCVENEIGEYKKFEDVKINVKEVYINDQFSGWIKKLSVEAKVETVPRVYNRIKVRYDDEI